MSDSTATPPLLDVRHLGKTVDDAGGQLDILHDISFTLQRGETAAIVGASGSGKSTLLGLLAGLDTPTQGEVRIDGENVFSLDEDGRAALRSRRIGFVFQSFHLLGHLSALENVMLALELRAAAGRETLDRDAAREHAAALLARVSLGHRLDHFPWTLSGGEQQRVALARAFVTEPELLLADEPTGSLDPSTGAAVIDLMFDLNRDRGATLILVTHDRALASRCGTLLALESGRLRELRASATAD